ncbi:MAG: chemotaxis protein CheB [Pseudomonadota bacterium]
MADTNTEQPYEIEPPRDPLKRKADLFVVGVGASAGGLEAIRDLFSKLPQRAPAAYVVVQHMSPSHKSLLATLVGRKTHLDVEELEDDTKPEANKVYVTPPNADVVYRDGVLRLFAVQKDITTPHPSIDRFFLSLAENAGDRAVGIVLSGTGKDGSFGIQAIRGAGGITIAQDDVSAKYDGMPVAAVETGCVDLVLAPHDIGTHLDRIIASPRNFDEFRSKQSGDHPLSELMQIVLARTRVDFRDYKPTTIQRRLERRMIAHGIEEQSDYVKVCRANPAEVDALFRDFLVSVTWFFRDPSEFMGVLPVLEEVAERNKDSISRIWIAGCATGEEAYSIAILMAEALGGPEHLTKDKVQIFATDIDAAALNTARAGRYSRAALDNVPDDYIERYFKVDDEGAQVVQALKDVVIFSYHNVCQDPPFINADLVCCRNLLIYFGTALQGRVLSRLNYALNQQGVIFLGTAETVSVSEDLFVRIGPRGHLFRKRQASIGSQSMRMAGLAGYGTRPGHHAPENGNASKNVERAMFDSLARSLGPTSILASNDHRILRIYGDIGDYVTMNETTSLQMSLSMLTPPLAQEARSLSTIALRNGARRLGITHRMRPDSDEVVQLEALPLAATTSDDERLVLLTITKAKDIQPTRPGDGKAEVSDAYVASIEKELNTTRDALQQTIEELETTNEELQSTNEELQSTNEELQATNEELETSNEELQSSNEELVTVNEELQISTNELTIINDELNTILQNIATPLLIIDSALQIAKASTEAIQLFGLVPPLDTPHLSQCRLPAGFPPLIDIANEALHLGRVVTREIETEREAYTLKCAPVSNNRGQLQGVTMTFMSSAQASRLTKELNQVMSHIPVMMMRRTPRGDILRLGDRTAEAFGLTEQEVSGKTVIDLYGAHDGAKIIAQDATFLNSGKASEIGTSPNTMTAGGKKAGKAYKIIRHRVEGGPDEAPSIFVFGLDPLPVEKS